jgi:hypothetical protein
MSEDVSKLPKWAQEKLRRMEADRDLWRARAEQYGGGVENSNVFIVDRVSPRLYGLGRNTCVHYVLPSRARVGVHHCTSQGPEGALTIYSSDSSLAVLSGASNQVHILAKPDNWNWLKGPNFDD